MVIDVLDENTDLSNRPQILSAVPEQIADANLSPHLRFPYSRVCEPRVSGTGQVAPTVSLIHPFVPTAQETKGPTR